MEQEFIQNQERLKPQEERQEEERAKVDELRGTPMAVGSLEEIIDDQHAIVSTVSFSFLFFFVTDLFRTSEANTTSTSCPLLIKSSWSQDALFSSIIKTTLLSECFQTTLTQWCLSWSLRRPHRRRTLMSEVSISRSRRSRKPWNCRLLTQSTTKKWEFVHRRESFCTVALVPERHFLPRPLPIRRLPRFCVSSDLSSSKSTWETDQRWFENSSELPKRMLHQLYSLTRLTPLELKDTIPTPEENVKSNVRCSSFSTSLTDSIRVETLKFWWPPTALNRLTPLSFVQDALIVRSSSHSQMRRRSAVSSR